mmetsp:Transcript_12574/g.33672  ORF Transcript_12574/g.33672 Transcript_12574/m.33672 type:complete len:241 (+) Transcript_12574:507-1229(+)
MERNFCMLPNFERVLLREGQHELGQLERLAKALTGGARVLEHKQNYGRAQRGLAVDDLLHHAHLELAPSPTLLACSSASSSSSPQGLLEEVHEEPWPECILEEAVHHLRLSRSDALVAENRCEHAVDECFGMMREDHVQGSKKGARSWLLQALHPRQQHCPHEGCAVGVAQLHRHACFKGAAQALLANAIESGFQRSRAKAATSEQCCELANSILDLRLVSWVVCVHGEHLGNPATLREL